MKPFIIITLIISYNVISANICADCVCRDNVQDNQDYLGENVDCSYYNGSANIFRTNFSLPSVVYSLDLSSNNITQLEASNILKSTTLIELSLDNNAIKEIRTKILRFPRLKWLDLSHNRLEYIDKEAFRGVNKLEYLNLANNRLTTHENVGFHRLSNLNELVLDNNVLGPDLMDTSLFDREGFGLTHKIQSLSISGLHLNEVPDNFFSDAYDIRTLIISHNNLTDTFEFPFTLEYLDLSDNPITEISEEDFSELPGLKVLKLNNLRIKEVPEYVFAPLHGLEHLELERNKNLTVFSSLAFGQEVLDDPDYFVLEKLSLKGSRLSKLEKDLAVPFGQLNLLDLQGNPWKCDCELTWLKTLQIQPEYYEHLRCGSPKPFYNSKIFELDSKYFSCTLTVHHIGLVIAVIAFCVCLASIAIWLFVYVPKYQSRGGFITHMYTAPTAAYTMLPMNSPGNN
ncbi:insulin-like growth factor-binding protein complex acid labile subunit [Ostrinia furnacalis]|uniref:insulin-like growth factor-binding protein complex acid labile subunit n=1 Tax=Ostrinia furnacalis TaxID=93504 RepID=UPI00103864DC|nr:insulin-like growth factor-binding protein complex acid labile subunit [Ostrinia furnacalis]